MLVIHRVSSRGQAAADRGGIPGQQLITDLVIQRHELSVAQSFQIVAVSGWRMFDTPVGRQILQLIQDPNIDGVVVAEPSRILRPKKWQHLAVLDQFVSSHTLIYTPDEVMDPGSLITGFRFLLSKEELKTMADRFKRSKDALRMSGKFVGGSVAFGAGITSDKGFEYSGDAAKMKIAFDAVLKGETNLTQLGRRLGIPRTTLKNLLKNPIFMGWRVYDTCRDLSDDGEVVGPDGLKVYRRKIPRDDVMRVKVIDPGLVSDEVFEAVQRILEARESGHKRLRVGTMAPYSTYHGFLFCALCGCPMYPAATQNNLFYVCKSHNSREAKKRATDGLQPCGNKYTKRKTLQANIDKAISSKLQRPAFLTQVFRAAELEFENTRQSSGVPSRAVIERKLTKLTAERSRVLKLFVKEVISESELDTGLNTIHEDLLFFEEIIRDADEQDANRHTLKSKNLKSVLIPLLQWEFLSRDDRRLILNALGTEIRVLKGEVMEIRFTRMPFISDRLL